MPVQKGHTNNPNGRPKGSSNKTTKEARELFIKIMNGEIAHIQKALESVREESPVKYLDVMSKLFQYSMPKHVDVTTGGDPISKIELVRGKEETKE